MSGESPALAMARLSRMQVDSSINLHRRSRHSRREAGASTIGMRGGIMDREERKYPEMPEREEQEDLRMLAEDPWADGTEIDSGWTEGTDDE